MDLLFSVTVFPLKNCHGRGGSEPPIVPGRQAVDACQIDPRRSPAGVTSARGRVQPMRPDQKRGIRIHASDLDRGASNLKPNLDVPDRNCRTIGTLLTTITLRRISNLEPPRCSSTERVRYPKRNTSQAQWLSRVTGRVSLPTRKSKSAP